MDTNEAVSRVSELMNRTKHDDLQELKIDRETLSELVIEQERTISDLREQLYQLEQHIALEETKLTATKKRLKVKIVAIAELELDEVGL